jgi:hypothetical protein
MAQREKTSPGQGLPAAQTLLREKSCVQRLECERSTAWCLRRTLSRWPLTVDAQGIVLMRAQGSRQGHQPVNVIMLAGRRQKRGGDASSVAPLTLDFIQAPLKLFDLLTQIIADRRTPPLGELYKRLQIERLPLLHVEFNGANQPAHVR